MLQTKESQNELGNKLMTGFEWGLWGRGTGRGRGRGWAWNWVAKSWRISSHSSPIKSLGEFSSPKGCLLVEEHLWTMLDISWREITAGDRCPVHKHCSSHRIWKIRQNCILPHNHPCTREQILHNKIKVPMIGEFHLTSPPFIRVPGKLALWREVAMAEFCTMTTLVIQLNFFPLVL